MTAHHIRNPIRKHGDKPSSHFVMIPNELARDAELSPYAYRIAIVIRTHAEGYEVSVASFAERYRWSRGRTGKAIEELVGARWIAKRTYVTVDGNRVFDEYHIHESRKFTEEESADLNRSVVIAARGVPAESSVMSPLMTTGCREREQLPVFNEDTKEDQPEHYSEKQRDNQKPACFFCEGSGWIDSNPCPLCRQVSNESAPRTSERTLPNTPCVGCHTFGHSRGVLRTQARPSDGDS